MQQQETPIEGRAPETHPRPAAIPQNTSAPPSWQIIMAGVIGVAFLAVLLSLAVFLPEPTAFQIFIFRVTLALAAGGLGALIPGFIEVQFRGLLRAGGALALFVIVYMLNPPALITEAVESMPSQRPVNTAPPGGG